MTTKEILEIILAAAGIILLAVLIYNLISPDFDKDEEAAKSYFASLEEQIGVADAGDVGRFSLWQDDGEDAEFFVVYFADKPFWPADKKFHSWGNNVNHICVCYVEGKLDTCGPCRDLNYPVKKDDSLEGWAIAEGESIEINREGDFYVVAKV